MLRDGKFDQGTITQPTSEDVSEEVFAKEFN